MFNLLNDWPLWRSRFDVLIISREWDWMGHSYTFKFLGVGFRYIHRFPKPPVITRDVLKEWEKENGIT